jgi:Ca2+-binding RTX toxin-like protein
LTGGTENDLLFGEDGDDILDGGDGADQITGARGNDVLAGGEGVDLYVYSLGDGEDTFIDSGPTPYI